MSDELKISRTDLSELARSIAGGIVAGMRGQQNSRPSGQSGGGAVNAYLKSKLPMMTVPDTVSADNQASLLRSIANSPAQIPLSPLAMQRRAARLNAQAKTAQAHASATHTAANIASFVNGATGIVGGFAIDAAVSTASRVADDAIGAGALGQAIDNYFNPKVYSAAVSGGDMGINDYLNGLYATAMTVNCPSKEDVKKIDNWLTWYGKPTEEMGVPVIYTSGQYKVNGKVINISVKNRYNFMFVKTAGAVVRCPNGQAKAQFEAMLNNGTRFWSVDTDIQSAPEA